MAARLCLLMCAIFGSLQVPTTAAPPTASKEVFSKYAAHLEKLSEELAKKLDALSTRIDTAISRSDAELSSRISRIEESWGKRVDLEAATNEACSNQTGRLFDLSSSIVSETKQCASSYRQKLQDKQLSSRLQSTSLQHAAKKLAGIGVECVEVNGQVPVCIVSTDPLSALADLLRKAGETMGTGSAQAAAYGAQVLSCWRQSATKASPQALEIIRDIGQCAQGQN